MQLRELTGLIVRAEAEHGGSSQVVAIDNETGETFSIKSVGGEVHDDADGSTTVWLKMEKN